MKNVDIVVYFFSGNGFSFPSFFLSSYAKGREREKKGEGGYRTLEKPLQFFFVATIHRKEKGERGREVDWPDILNGTFG